MKKNEMPSNRRFGLLWVVVALAVASYYRFYQFNELIVQWALMVAAGSLVIALLLPILFAPFNKLWFWLGLALGKVVSPVVLALLFFVIITPFAVVMRLFGRDELRLKRRPTDSYWRERTAASFNSSSFKNQF